MLKKQTDHYHGVSKFDVLTGEQVKSGTNLASLHKSFCKHLG